MRGAGVSPSPTWRGRKDGEHVDPSQGAKWWTDDSERRHPGRRAAPPSLVGRNQFAIDPGRHSAGGGQADTPAAAGGPTGAALLWGPRSTSPSGTFRNEAHVDAKLNIFFRMETTSKDLHMSAFKEYKDQDGKLADGVCRRRMQWKIPKCVQEPGPRRHSPAPDPSAAREACLLNSSNPTRV